MIGRIEKANRSTSGKSLGVLVKGKWFITKNWELEQMVGKTIEFYPSETSYQGKPQFWINEYVETEEGATGNQQVSVPSDPTPGDARLLDFVGRCVAASVAAGRPIEESDTVARVAYKIASDVLSGRLAAKAALRETVDEMRQPEQPDFDDDIPF